MSAVDLTPEELLTAAKTLDKLARMSGVRELLLKDNLSASTHFGVTSDQLTELASKLEPVRAVTEYRWKS